MDPYVESGASWSSFHSAFISICASHLNQILPRNYVARIEERLQVLSEEEEEELGVIPDNVVTRKPASATRTPPNAGAVATLEPHTLPQDIEWLDEPVETFIHIQKFPEERVVTGFEMLSPSNKSGKGRAAYLAKRFEYRHQHMNLVELDLLLGGQRVPLLAPLPEGHYYAFVTRAPTRHQCDVYAWTVRDPLPTIPIPLDKEDGDVQLNLKTVFDRVFHEFRYDMLVRYAVPPPRELGPADREWCAGLVAAHNR